MENITIKRSYAYLYLIDKEQVFLLSLPGIYKIGFVGTSKFYIGSTTESILARFRRHFNSLKQKKHCNQKLQRAYLKYKGNITLEILESCKSEECIVKEQYYIDTLQPKYNICKVAGNTLGFKMPEYIVKTKSKPIDMFDLSGNFLENFKSIAEASRKTGIHLSSISQCLKNNGRAKDFMFRYANQYKDLPIYTNPNKHKIICYSIKGFFIKEYSSILEASKDLSIPVGNICKHLQGKYKSCYNYIFQYYKDNYPLIIDAYTRKHKNQKKIIITDLVSNEIKEFSSIRQIDNSICTRGTISSISKKKGNDFIIKKKYRVQIITCESNEITEIN